MLVLSRKLGESLIINDDIKIMILSSNGKQVRIGVDAPKEISVHREEIFQKIQDEKSQRKEGCNLNDKISDSFRKPKALVFEHNNLKCDCIKNNTSF